MAQRKTVDPFDRYEKSIMRSVNKNARIDFIEERRQEKAKDVQRSVVQHSRESRVQRVKQTGTSISVLDVARQAKRPGYRRSKSGKVYYESRKNRSDVPGSRI